MVKCSSTSAVRAEHHVKLIPKGKAVTLPVPCMLQPHLVALHVGGRRRRRALPAAALTAVGAVPCPVAQLPALQHDRHRPTVPGRFERDQAGRTCGGGGTRDARGTAPCPAPCAAWCMRPRAGCCGCWHRPAEPLPREDKPSTAAQQTIAPPIPSPESTSGAILAAAAGGHTGSSLTVTANLARTADADEHYRKFNLVPSMLVASPRSTPCRRPPAVARAPGRRPRRDWGSPAPGGPAARTAQTVTRGFPTSASDRGGRRSMTCRRTAGSDPH